DRVLRHGHRVAAQRDVSRQARQRPRGAGAHLGQDAQEPHPRAGRRPRKRRDDALRSEQGTHHLPLQIGGIALSDAPAEPRRAAPDRLVLASASPRRAALMAQIGWPADIVEPPAIDETVRPGELPRAHALRLAQAKLEAVVARHPGCFVIAADTVVACGRRILPKAEDEATGPRCLALLSGRRHRVHGAIAMAAPSGGRAARLVTTGVTVKRLTAIEIDRYIASDEWRGKAGAYAIQGRAAALISAVTGSYSNVVGLSLFDAYQMLTGLG